MRPMIRLRIRIDLGCPALAPDRDHRPRRAHARRIESTSMAGETFLLSPWSIQHVRWAPTGRSRDSSAAAEIFGAVAVGCLLATPSAATGLDAGSQVNAVAPLAT